MKKYLSTDPGKLYLDCWEYVVACTMANCRHLSRQDAEDMTSQAFLELYAAGKTNIQNWVWLSKMRGRWDYIRHYSRYQNKADLLDYQDLFFNDSVNIEVFRLKSLLVRKDAKACFDIWSKGYNRVEVAKILGYFPPSVTTMVCRLRKGAKRALKRDIDIYNGKIVGSPKQ